ncbi:hypothetical protein E2K80_15175 [Rhodophyticola sp. CCM32]|uniref:hypothetical protein n=1 Tax=Rhodophyticola sp. CCM32 TaxID=2916397 RepID=UPI00107EF684|nr:hypothetical protein [Rhodophyticola sp. CCM32]QBY01902.1 hypothetical protein E2K80_15175 [Rhodophyticola sp. CCM32]
MRIQTIDGGGRPITVFPVFYDVPQNSLSLETFVATATDFSKLIESFNQEIFGGQIQYKIYVLPPEAGSFGQKLGVVVIAGVSAVVGAISSSVIGDFGKGFVEGVVGQPLEEWGEEVGSAVRYAIREWHESDGDQTQALEQDQRQMEQGLIACGALTSLGQHFLTQTTEEFRSAGLDVNNFPSAFEAKSDFYKACELNPQISGVGFSDFPEFPIRREEFQRRVTPIKRDDDEDWKFENVKFFVTSPNWDQMDRQRGWKGRDARGGIAFFQIYDPGFWTRYDEGRVNSQNIDEVVGQIAYQMINGRQKGRIMLNVVSFNDTPYSPELSEIELRLRLEEHLNRPLVENEDELF